MSNPTAGQLVRRLATAFAISFALLTGSLLTNYATKQLPLLSARGDPTSIMVEYMLMAVPFTAAMTIPMSVLVAVLWVFTRLGKDGTLAAARSERHGIRRLVTPLLRAAALVAALTLVMNDQILPRANARLSALQSGVATHQRGDREMTIWELRAEARNARANDGPDGLVRAVALDVEIQKKLALAAACVVLALAGVALALLIPSGGVALVIVASWLVFPVYYVGLIAGEALADRLLVSPFVAMWLANALLLPPALLILWRRSRPPRAPRGTEPVPVAG
jgi:lipopolysaccharide export LptBFGC system permease protein LptF